MLPSFFLLRLITLLSLIFGLLATSALANPEPDIPVRCHFDKDGSCTITVEVDPRCFTADPMLERFFMKVDLTYRSAEELKALKDQAADAVSRWIQFQCEPELATSLKLEFDFTFTGQGQASLVKADDPVVITGTWRFQRHAGMTGLRVHAAKEARYSIVVRHFIDDIEQKRSATLFPGETSFQLEVAESKKRKD